jgi:hypothetical protein
MPLCVAQLKKVRTIGKKIVAQCPACHEVGQDKTGNHLVVWPGGSFGCVANPADKEHRRRIWQLAGDHAPRKMIIRRAV